jgi:hypothetical protein
MQVIYPTEIGWFAVMPALDTAAMKDELVADFGIASPQVSAAAAFVILILSGFSAPHGGATVYQSNGSVASVQALHNAAHNGDTITIPAGTFTWATGVTFTKAITFQGAGVGNTIILDAMTTGARIIHFTLVPGRPSRLTGIEIRNGGRTKDASSGFLGVLGQDQRNGQTFRIDHCKFDSLRGNIDINALIGVIDHNEIITRAGAFIHMHGMHWNGATSLWGDSSMSSPFNWGSGEFVFIEDNTYTGTFPTAARGFTDGDSGCRFVVRHNTITDGSIGVHGTDSGGRQRTGLAYEVYNNHFISTGGKGNSWGSVRGGVVLLHDNTLSGFLPNPSFPMSYFRLALPAWAGGANGQGLWDVNAVPDVVNSGNPSYHTTVMGPPPGPFFSGTAATNSVQSGPFSSVTVSGSPGWAINQWQGYTIQRNTNLGGDPGLLTFSEIQSNTANVIQYRNNSGNGQVFKIAAGDSFQLFKVVQGFDMSGTSLCPLLGPENPAILPPNFHQDITPCYSWNNIMDGGAHANIGQADFIFKGGIHYVNDTPKPGYTPYVYPHPLVSGAPTPTPSATPRSQQHLQKKKKNSKKLKRRNWPKKSASDMAERLARGSHLVDPDAIATALCGVRDARLRTM